MKRLTLFNTYAEYTGASLNLDIPNVTYCKDTPEVVYYKEHCDAVDWYEVSGEVSYPAQIDGGDTSFTMQIPYNHIMVDTSCTRTIVAGVDSVVIECGTNPSTADSRTVSGTYVYHGIEIPYSLTQTKSDPSMGHEYVEIGGLKWATMNVGSTGITDYGLYFQWGDTQGYTASQVGSGAGQKYFGWADYKYGNGTSSPGKTGMTKYNESDEKTVLEASDDAVTANWGGGWRMPTTDEYMALEGAVNTAWTYNYQGSGASGMVFTDKTDSSKVLFFPAAGYCSNGSVNSVGSSGSYWSSSLNTSNVVYGYRLYFDSSGVRWQSYYNRCRGFAVRGVLGDN